MPTIQLGASILQSTGNTIQLGAPIYQVPIIEAAYAPRGGSMVTIEATWAPRGFSAAPNANQPNTPGGWPAYQ